MSTLELENIKHPDNSGNNLTLAADGSIGSLNLSGNMGIGTNTPGRQLHVNSGATNVVAKFESTDGIAAVEFTDNAGSAEVGTNAGAVVFYPSGIEKARISTQGYLTTPNQPAFGIESSYTYSSTGTGEQVFNSSTVYYNNTNIRANVGSHWSSSTGRFTAPVAGSYSFTFNVDVKSHNSGYLLIRIRKNGSQMVGIYPDQTSAKERVTLNTILTLAAGDYMDVSWNNNYATPIFSYASFSGFLIG